MLSKSGQWNNRMGSAGRRVLPRFFLTFEVYNNVSSTKSHTTKVQKPLLKGNFLLVHSLPPLKGEVPPQRRRGCPCMAAMLLIRPKKLEFPNRELTLNRKGILNNRSQGLIWVFEDDFLSAIYQYNINPYPWLYPIEIPKSS